MINEDGKPIYRDYTLKVEIVVYSTSMRDAEDHVLNILQKAFDKDNRNKGDADKLQDFDFYLTGDDE